jgi:hypothetical protein
MSPTNTVTSLREDDPTDVSIPFCLHFDYSGTVNIIPVLIVDVANSECFSNWQVYHADPTHCGFGIYRPQGSMGRFGLFLVSCPFCVHEEPILL